MRPAPAAPSEGRRGQVAGLLLDRVLCCVIVAILAARPLISGQYEHLDLDFLHALETPRGPTPAATAVLDLILLAVSGVVLARGQRWRRIGGWGLAAGGLLLGAVVVSTLASEDRHVAALAGSSLVAILTAGTALTLLVDRPSLRAVALAALLATGGVTALKCIRQSTDEWQATRDYWERDYKPALLAQGYRDDDPLIVTFERRLRSREAHGLLGHPNVTASLLALWGLVALGATAGLLASWRSLGGIRGSSGGRGRLLALAIAGAAYVAGVIVALRFTGSLGAAVAAAAGAAVLTLGGSQAARLARHARGVAATFFACYLAGATALVTCGLVAGRFPHDSLQFRWYYWTAAASAWAEAPLTGIGRANFAPAYLRFKPVEGTEEVRDPHSVWVSLLTELGPLGLAAGFIIAALVIGAATRQLGTGNAPEQGRQPPGTHAKVPDAAPFPGELKAALLPAAGVLGLLTLTHVVFSATPLDQPELLLVWISDILGPWTLSFAATLAALVAMGSHARARQWLAAGVLAGLVAVLTHAGLDFALLTPGGLAAVVLAAGAGLPRRLNLAQTAASRPSDWRERLPALGALVLVVAHVVLVVAPAERDRRAALLLDQVRAARASPQTATDFLTRAAGASDLNLRRSALRLWISISRTAGSGAGSEKSLQSLAVAADALVARQPHHAHNHAILAQVWMLRAEAAGRGGDAEAARAARTASAAAWERASRLDPTNPRTHIAAGFAWLRTTDERDDAAVDPAILERVRTHFIEALRVDDLRSPEEAQRLRPAEREPVENWLRAQTHLG
ncbi:MAG: O-antigen ligase family protein [Phycisphaerales bacterium]|nr:O-antigen ligase family protein [Phycisphaerales bacterium]